MNQNSSNLIDLYNTSSQKYLQDLKDNLILLQQDSCNTTALETAFRCIHSLKSENLFMQHPHTARLCEFLEKIFHTAVEQKKIEPKILTTITNSIASLEKELETIKQTQKELDLSETITMLETISL